MESCAILRDLGERFLCPLLPLNERKWTRDAGGVLAGRECRSNSGKKLRSIRYIGDIDPAAKAHPQQRFGQEAWRLMGVLCPISFVCS